MNEENKMKIIKNPKRLVVKLFVLVWVFLILHILLKVTFNYWQPYVIPTPQLQAISDFIDKNYWISVLLDKILFIINTLLMVLSSIQEWWFKKKYPIIIIIVGAILSFVDDFTPYNSLIDSFIALSLGIVLPIIINYKKWLPTILTFGLSNIFLYLSLWLEGTTNVDNLPYIIGILLNNDYYIMLIANYFVFNLIDFYVLFKIIFKKRRK